MAQLDYDATLNDSLTILESLFARGDLRVYVDRRYPEPEAKHYTSLTAELRAELETWNRAYLFGAFSTHPPLFFEIPGQGYSLAQSGGGPLVSLELGRERRQDDGRLLIAGGDLSTQPQYELEPDRWEKPGPALKDANADMQKRLKKHLVRWEGIWITPAALRMLKEGKAEHPNPRLTALARKAKYLPQLGPAVPVTSKKTTKRKIAARTATP